MLWLPLLIVLGAGCSARTAEQPAPGTTVSVTGSLVDIQCQALALTGDARPDCPGRFVKQGYPAGLIEDENSTGEGTVWVLVTVPQIVQTYLGRTVRIKGVVRSEGVLIPDRIELKEGDQWRFVY